MTCTFFRISVSYPPSDSNLIAKESRLRTIELNQVQRQIPPDYREAIKALRHDPVRGFEELDKMGVIREVRWLDRASEVAKAFSEAETRGQNSLVVCATHEEIDRVTHAIRMFQGKLGKGVEVGKDVSLNWTIAQKSDMSNYRPGQLFVFHRPVEGIGREVAGYGLGSLLEGLSKQRVSLLREPVRAERFNSDPDPRITSISIQKVE